MRLLNYRGRASLSVGDGAVDIKTASEGKFPSDIQGIYDDWANFTRWAQRFDGTATIEIEEHEIGPPVPRPPQVFAVGMNYRSHVAEGNMEIPTTPMIFTKFPSSVTGPFNEIALPSSAVDFEAELVVVIGKRAVHVPEDEAWSYVAGLTIGQDLSERNWQMTPPAPQQFSLSKSFTGFAPIGPTLVTPDEFENCTDLNINCYLSGTKMQDGHTRELIFPVATLISFLSSVLPLLPGDLIFTGTPSGIGWTRTPKRTLQPDDELVTTIPGIGTMRNRFKPSAALTNQ
ncbi:fumarylacetoacetate hydrolase family protein [Rhodococcus wratislaviensis]|uniref:Fumarylacetoacetate hydrolase family protein n=1 Tax=Rhodococcus wratislaviensis NBRC 100605 TaxID=1219028 RepID=X0PMB7_RHOWR|nr:fumarylacetoacetate hydrolase family protein [Rhodococcus wratislaviensis]GAF43593.1 fumarylacetoacetate hydrolase family protein [Rhodococcus wratislaviensis NBRC 100605]